METANLQTKLLCKTDTYTEALEREDNFSYFTL